MEFHRTPQFRDDFNNLTNREKVDVRAAFPFVAQALQGNVEYYRKHKIKKMKRYRGVWEGHVKDNLCFTFHFSTIENGERACFFRRVGTHDIYNSP